MTTAEAPTITFARMMEVAAAVSGLDMASLYVKGDDLEQYAKRHFIYLLCTGTPLCKPTRGEIMRTLGMTNYAMFRVTLSKIKHRADADPGYAASLDAMRAKYADALANDTNAKNLQAGKPYSMLHRRLAIALDLVNTPPDQLFERNRYRRMLRNPEMVNLRAMVYMLLRERVMGLSVSLSPLASHIGINHSTIVTACNRVRRAMQTDEGLKRKYAELLALYRVAVEQSYR